MKKATSTSAGKNVARTRIRRKELLKPEARRKLALRWMHNFGISTRPILMFVGCTRTDIEAMHKDKILETIRYTIKSTHQKAGREISCVVLREGWRKAAGLPPEEKCTQYLGKTKRPEDQERSHDLAMQAWFAILCKTSQIREYVGPARIRAGYFTDPVKREYWGIRTRVTTHGDKAWAFDLVFAEQTLGPTLLEWERSRKIKKVEIARFAEKISAMHDAKVLVVSQSEADEKTWRERFEDWHLKGVPDEEGNSTPFPLAKIPATAYAPKEPIEQVLGFGVSKAGKSGKSGKKTQAPSLDATRFAFDEAAARQEDARMQALYKRWKEEVEDKQAENYRPLPKSWAAVMKILQEPSSFDKHPPENPLSFLLDLCVKANQFDHAWAQNVEFAERERLDARVIEAFKRDMGGRFLGRSPAEIEDFVAKARAGA